LGLHKDIARKALRKLAGPHVPASLKALERAIAKVEAELDATIKALRAVSNGRSATDGDAAVERNADDDRGGHEPEGGCDARRNHQQRLDVLRPPDAVARTRRGARDLPYCTVFGTQCKRPRMDELASGRRVFYVGDGLSDLCAARGSTRVFACGTLASTLDEEGTAYVQFSTFDDIRADLAVPTPPSAHKDEDRGLEPPAPTGEAR
jgi:hypothetical protein